MQRRASHRSIAQAALIAAVSHFMPFAPASLSAQHDAHVTMPRSFSEPMPLYEVGLGSFTRPITTTSGEAQAYFDQGIQFLYAFTPEDAARSFREASSRDSTCAMCWFGEAWAWGPYLNGPMGGDDAPRAHAAIQRALQLAPGHTTDVERAMIDAMAVRYEPEHDADRRATLDSVYSRAMADVYRRFPADLDVGTLYAESLMLLEPRRGTWDIESASVGHIHHMLEEVLARDISHPGACHLYIHATESTTRPGKAENCADLLGSSIPGASHINHMPSHTYNRVGRWGDAVRANIQAWHSDLAAVEGEGFAIYPSHNLHMLLFAASFDGQGAIAIQAGKDYAKIQNGGDFYHVLTLLRFGRFDEILALDVPLSSNAVSRGFVEFGMGYAHLRTGSADSANAWLVRLEESLAAGGDSVNFRGHAATQLLGVVHGILAGELQRSVGRLDDAIARFEAAVAIEDGLRYDEPEPLNFSARHWLGAALLEADRNAEAERVYLAELEDHPNNGWSLSGLEQAVRAQGRATEADALRERFAAAWARSDTRMRASRF
jgi:tetratricopeptide (TPR) repeat protein